MADCLVIVETGGYQAADLVAAEFIHAAAQAFRRIKSRYPDEIEALCSKEQTAAAKPQLEAPEVCTVTLTGIVLATSLKRAGVEFVLFDGENILESYRNQLDALLQSSVKVACISTTFLLDIKKLNQIIDFLHSRDKDIKIIIGGQCLYTWGEAALKKIHNVFCFCYGDMDTEIGKIVADLLASGKPPAQLIPLTEKAPACFTVRHFTPDLDATPMPDWTLLTQANINDHYYLRHPLPDRIPVEEKRGCVNRCSFCSYHTLNKYRRKSSQRILEELLNVKKSGFNKVNFVGSEFLTPVSKTRETLKMIIKNKLNMDIWCFARIDFLAKHLDMIDLMAEAGITTVYFGLESGDQSILKNMNKNYNLENIPFIIEKLKGKGISIYASFIFGFPGETMETIKNTTDFVIKSNISTIELHALQIIPNTPLHINRDAYQLKLLGNYWSHPTMALSDIPKVIRKFFMDIYQKTDTCIYSINYELVRHFLYSGYTYREFGNDKTKNVTRCLERMIYTEFNDTIDDKDTLIFEAWHELKQYIDCVPRWLLEKQSLQ